MSTWVRSIQPSSRPIEAHLYYVRTVFIYFFFTIGIPSLVICGQGYLAPCC